MTPKSVSKGPWSESEGRVSLCQILCADKIPVANLTLEAQRTSKLVVPWLQDIHLAYISLTDVSLPVISLLRHFPTQPFLYFKHFPTKTFHYQDISLQRHFPTKRFHYQDIYYQDISLPRLFPTKTFPYQ